MNRTEMLRREAAKFGLTPVRIFVDGPRSSFAKNSAKGRMVRYKLQFTNGTDEVSVHALADCTAKYVPGVEKAYARHSKGVWGGRYWSVIVWFSARENQQEKRDRLFNEQAEEKMYPLIDADQDARDVDAMHVEEFKRAKRLVEEVNDLTLGYLVLLFGLRMQAEMVADMGDESEEFKGAVFYPNVDFAVEYPIDTYLNESELKHLVSQLEKAGIDITKVYSARRQSVYQFLVDDMVEWQKS